MNSEAGRRRKSRPFKSAEKPVSLHPLAFKQALVALLQIDPKDIAALPVPSTKVEAARDTDSSDRRPEDPNGP